MLVNSALIIVAYKKEPVSREKIKSVPCICYAVRFQEKHFKTLHIYGSKVYTICLNYAENLQLQISKTNMQAQKYDACLFRTDWIILAVLPFKDILAPIGFFKEKFLIVNMQKETILKTLFFSEQCKYTIHKNEETCLVEKL